MDDGSELRDRPETDGYGQACGCDKRAMRPGERASRAYRALQEQRDKRLNLAQDPEDQDEHGDKGCREEDGVLTEYLVPHVGIQKPAVRSTGGFD
jgi:hypothetical protein